MVRRFCDWWGKLVRRRRKRKAMPERTWKLFVEDSRKFFDENWGCPEFGLIERVDELYLVASAVAPFPKSDTERDNLFRMCFSICHRALLSAATSAGSGFPEDGAAITRRALEAAKVALAITVDAGNLEEWRAVAARTGRWEDRGKGVKPKGGPINPQYNGLRTEPLYQDLMAFIATLSDFAVHFTPEHVLGYEWEKTINKDGTTKVVFGLNEDEFRKELRLIADHHRLILRVFDRCLDGKLYGNADVQSAAQKTIAHYKDLLEREGFTEEIKNVGDVW